MPILALEGISPELPPAGEYWIAPNAYVIGKVALGLRGDNEQIEIGAGTNIQENCVLHTDKGVPFKVGRGCTVGHRAVLHGCTIGDNCLIGIGATILNNTVIGENCLIGANTLLTEGKSIPAGSLVMGSPGKAVRSLSPEEIERIRQTASRYTGKARLFASQLSEAPISL
ncbi:MAG: gamma carbonic anhydrase family protein [Rhodomicrobium sp.]|nr:gamma carbonic anhydrase family protein [Rhodomicrobium sp.]